MAARKARRNGGRGALSYRASRITRNGTALSLAGSPWYFYGGSINGQNTPASDTVTRAQDLKLNVVRFTDYLDTSSGTSLSTGPYDETRWAKVDANIAALSAVGIKSELDLSAYRNAIENHFITGSSGNRINPYTYDWTTFLTWVANRVNTVSGLAYKDDPGIALVAFAGEPLPPAGNDSNNDIRPTTAQLTAFYTTVSATWKSLAPSTLCTNGGFLQLDWSSGVDWQAIAALSNIDVFTLHAYPNNDGTDKADITTVIPTVGTYLYSTLAKPWILEEFGYKQAIGDDNRAAKFHTMYDRMSTYHGAGVAFWNIGGGTGDTFDVATSTVPLTAGAVKDRSPQTSSWGMPYLTRTGTDLYQSGVKWRGAGVNWHWAGLRESNLTYPTHTMIDEIYAECSSLGANFIRAHTLGISAGISASLVTSVNADGSLVWNTAAWEPIDYVVQQARARKIRLLVPFTDQFDYYHKGKQWWVSQAFVRQGTSLIPSSYTYSGSTENGVTSFDPSSGSVGGSARYKIISQQFYKNTWIRNAFINNYVGGWFEHVNQYTGVANKNEPAIAFAQMGNELWDSGDQWGDHAGADGISCVAQFNALVKSKRAGVMTVDPMGASGTDPDYSPGRADSNEDIIDAQHLYIGGDTLADGAVTAYVNKVAALGKVAIIGEYAYTNAGIGNALDDIEDSSATMGGAFWAIYSASEGHTSGGTDDTVYVIGGNPTWKSTFQAHAAIMKA